MELKLFIGGRWVAGGDEFEVKNKYSGEVVGAVVSAREEDVASAVAAAETAAPTMAELPAHRRADILARTASGLQQRRKELAEFISKEAGKAMKYSLGEVDRSIGTFQIAAEEAKRIHGETVPLDALPSGEGYFGFWLRRPVGIVAAITPFNFPLNLVAHKVAPAIAAGNSLVLKPACTTPLIAGILCQILQEAGLPDGGINLINGPGRTVGDWLVTDPRVAKISFTGSPQVGRRILSRAGIKKVTLELGNISPVIVAPDADPELVAKKCAVGAYYNSGQVCISVQCIYSDQKLAQSLTEHFVEATRAMIVGDPLDETVDVGPMIDLKEAERIEAWVSEAQSAGAKVLAGGRRERAVFWPTVLSDVNPSMKVVSREAFGPIASVIPCDNFESALRQAGQSEYGLQASIFTRDIERILHGIKKLNFGGIIVNEAPNFRADHMPYGGNRQSGLGREGLRFAIEDMTNIQMVVIREKA